MNKHEKLERLLTEREVPEPPADLLDKIKNEIPSELPAQQAPSEPAPARWWGWRIAASLVLLIGMGYIGFRIGRQGYEYKRDATFEPRAVITESRPAAAPPRQEEVAATLANEATRRDAATEVAAKKAAEKDREVATSEVAGKPAMMQSEGKLDTVAEQRFTVAEGIATPASPPAEPPAAAPAPADASGRLRAKAMRDEAQKRPQSKTEGGVVGGVVGGVLGGIVSKTEAITVVAPPAAQPAPSTGGTAEPNDQPYGDNFFKNYGVNPFIDTEDDALSTFGLDVDTASYTVARRFLLDGHLPPPSAIRTEEFLNYFDYGDQPPARGDFAIYADGGEAPFPRGPRYAMVRFGIRARTVSIASRAPAVLTFVVDTSGSMARENRLELVKRALSVLLSEMREDDRVGLVVFANEAEVILEPTGDHDAIRQAIARLTSRGSTNLADGMQLGYETAVGAFRRGANNRVILCSDGVANVGSTSAEPILRQVEEMKNRGVQLTTIGVGMGNFNDVLLEQLADKGNGHYAYVDDLEEAQRVFVENLTGTLQTVADDARVQVEFNPRTVSRYRLIGYENRDIADHRFRDDSSDAGEIGAGHGVVALYEIKLQSDAPRGEEVATLTLRYRPSAGRSFRELEKVVRLSDLARSWESGPARLQLAAIVATFAEVLKESYWAKELDLDQLVGKAQVVASRFPDDDKVRELVRLIRRAADLKGPSGED